jgi:DNA (cytosine-5)-methyltransferase 1
MEKLRVLDLFSGIGGFSLGLERTGGFETAAFCEIEKFPRQVLAKHWPEIEIYDDVRTVPMLGGIDVVCGGYPCQPFSTAGRRKGAEDDRHLWPAMFSIIQRERPSWVIGENVAGHVSMGLDQVLSDLESEGYAARPFIIPACATDAPHRRDRIWIMAYAESIGHRQGREARDVSSENGRQGRQVRGQFSGPSAGPEVLANTPNVQRNGGNDNAGKLVGGKQKPKSGNDSGPVALANANAPRLQGRTEAGNIGSEWTRGDQQPERCANRKPRAWPTEPRVGRVANGIPNRVDRLKGLDNAVVPAVVERIGRAILAAERARR